ncbi:transmembrane protein, putative, partial (macronuclear) [Tetrahymena thermophila SB210]
MCEYKYYYNPVIIFINKSKQINSNKKQYKTFYKMKFITLAILAILALSTVRASFDVAKALQCYGQTQQPCQASDQACQTDYQAVQACWTKNNCSVQNQSNSDYLNCVNSCPAQTSAVKGYISSYLNCLDSTILSLIGAIMALFFLYI